MFVDGELALMVAARRVLADDPRHAEMHGAFVDRMVAQFERSPVLQPESYPDEAWLYCNSQALVAVREELGCGAIARGRCSPSPP